MEERAKRWKIWQECRVSGRSSVFLSLSEICCHDVWLAFGLLWTWESVEDIRVIFIAVHMLQTKTMNLIAETVSEQVSALLVKCCIAAKQVSPLSLRWFCYICRMTGGSGINVNSTVNIMMLCTAMQVTEIKSIVWNLCGEPSLNCIFSHWVFLSLVQLLVCLWLWRKCRSCCCSEELVHPAVFGFIGCDLAERFSLNAELLSFWCWLFSSPFFHSRKMKVLELIEGGTKEM